MIYLISKYIIYNKPYSNMALHNKSLHLMYLKFCLIFLPMNNAYIRQIVALHQKCLFDYSIIQFVVSKIFILKVFFFSVNLKSILNELKNHFLIYSYVTT